jgi:predicted Zn-dependent protease
MNALRTFLAISLAIVAAGCATNPATGKRQISLMSENKEIEIGRQMDAEVRRDMGVYRDEKLQQYVEEIGMKLAHDSPRPNLPWHFTIVDSPAINAFALPGGYIYITRGILPFLDNEAQLAGVLGHEIGHVAARHSAQQYTRSAGTSLGVLLGSIFVPQVGAFGQLAETGLSMMFLKYSRENELEADALGTEYAAAGGWDPAQVPALLTTLARIEAVSDRSGTPNWLQTHPQPENRVAKVQTTVQKVRDEGKSWTVDREPFLDRITGVAFGENPEEGIVRGSEFIHPALRFAVTFPSGWEITNGEEQVIVQEPGNKIFMVLETVQERRRVVQQTAEAHMRGAGYRTTDGSATDINGLAAFVGTYAGKAGGIGPVTVRGAHIVSGRHTYFVGGIAKPDEYARVSKEFNDTIASFRELERNEADSVESNRLDLYTVREGDTWQSIAEHVGKGFVKASTLAIMNDHSVDDQPRAGDRIKIVVGG